jgi:hypothetical protein
MRRTIRTGLTAGLWLLALAIPTGASAAIEVGIEVTGCSAPLGRDSVCELRASWSGGSARFQEITILEAVKQDVAPGRGDFRATFRAQGAELSAPSPEGFRRTRRTSEFGSWLFEGQRPFTYCVKSRVKDDTGAQAESQPVCLTGKP